MEWVGGGLSEPNWKKPVDAEFALSRLLIFFSPCTLLNLLERNTSSRSVILAPGHHAKFCHLCGMAEHLYYMLYSGIGLDPAILITTSGGWGCGKGKGLHSSPSEVSGEVWEQGACCTCLEQGVFHGYHKHLVCAVSNLNCIINFCSYRLVLDWSQIWVMLLFWPQHFQAVW